MKRIPVSGPSISQKEIDYVTDAVTNAWYGNANMYHERFEKAFAEYLGVRYSVALPSCTSAIHLSLLALGVGPGDEVIVPDATWIASTAPVSYVGATPVFADVDRKTWCLDAGSFERCITPKTKAVIPVDLYGGMPDMDALRAIAQKYGIPIIEDAAEAIGSEYKGKKAGSFGHTGVFSFHGSKTLTTGEGGILVTDDETIFKRVSFLRDHGRKPGDVSFWNSEVAYKYKMSSMQAALGLAQLERIDELVRRKREIFAFYQKELQEVKGVTLNHEPVDVKNTYWMVTVLIDPTFGFDKGKLMAAMLELGVDCRPFFYPLSSMPAYAHLDQVKNAKTQNPVSYAISGSGINLPSGLNMNEELVHTVCEALNKVLATASKI
jgi:perosamine synthetase